MYYKMKFFLIAIAILSSSTLLSKDGELYIYSSRHYNIDKTLIDQFSAQTGIKVYLYNGSSDKILVQLNDRSKTKADLLITSDMLSAQIVKSRGLLQPISKKILNFIPKNLQDPDNLIVPLTKRLRVIVYNKEHVNPDLINTYSDLADLRWHGKLTFRDSSSAYTISLVSSMVKHHGVEETKRTLASFMHHVIHKPKGRDRDQILLVAEGKAHLTIANHYYVANMMYASDKKGIAEKIGIILPNQNDTGTHVNLSTMSLLKSAKNKDAAMMFIEFMLQPHIQEQIMHANYEFPINQQVILANHLTSMRGKEDYSIVEGIAQYKSDVLEILNEVGWR